MSLSQILLAVALLLFNRLFLLCSVSQLSDMARSVSMAEVLTITLCRWQKWTSPPCDVESRRYGRRITWTRRIQSNILLPEKVEEEEAQRSD